MDVRKIQITGGSSFMITLPKEWADSVGLKKNDAIGLLPQSDGSLVLYPGGAKSIHQGTRKVISADGQSDPDFLYRQLVGAYIAGHSSIEIVSETDIPSSVANIASSFTQTAIGLEIMEESDVHVLIQDLMDQREMRPSKSVERMKVLVRNMLNDALDTLDSKDASVLKNYQERDREVDRLDWLVSRQVNIHQKDITISMKMGMDLCEISRCATISRSIERIGDHAVLLATNLIPIIDSGLLALDEKILSAGREAVKIFTDSVATWSNRDMAAANACIERGEDLVKRALAIGEIDDVVDERTAVAAELIAGNVKRVTEYSMDIAEIAINSAMDR